MMSIPLEVRDRDALAFEAMKTVCQLSAQALERYATDGFTQDDAEYLMGEVPSVLLDLHLALGHDIEKEFVKGNRFPLGGPMMPTSYEYLRYQTLRLMEERGVPASQINRTLRSYHTLIKTLDKKTSVPATIGSAASFFKDLSDVL